jgi:hypothetical protein
MSNRDKYTRISFNRDHLVKLLTECGIGEAQLGTVLGYGTDDTDSYQSYWDTVETLASEAWDSVLDHGADENDAIHEAIDGNYWLIYTHAILKVLQYTENDDALWDVGAELGDTESSTDVYGRIAYYAMSADVRDRFENMRAERQPDTDDDESDDE